MAEGFDFVLVAAAKFSRHPAIVDRPGGRTISFTELERLTRERAHGLLKRNEPVVAVQAPASAEYLLWLIAAFRCGVTVFPVSPRLPAAAARELAQRAGASELIDSLSALHGPERPFQNQLTAPATLLATSGSSGTPKLVAHSLAGHLTNARGSHRQLPLGPGCGWLLNLPLHHVSGLSIVFRCLQDGAAIILPESASLADPAVTHLSVVSTQLRRLLESGARLDHLRAVLAGGGPFPAELVNQAIAAGYPIHLTYGMTEAASQIATTPRLIRPAEAFSAGPPNPEMRVRIAPSGEVQIHSQALCLGYLEADGAIRSARDAGGWFATRDAGRIDEEGQLWITGRLDRMFISGGENIHPEILEQALEARPEIRRAVVLPIADPEFDQRPVAFVQWTGEPREELVAAELARRLPRFMLPARWLDWPAGVDSQGGKLPLEPFRREVRQIDAASPPPQSP